MTIPPRSATARCTNDTEKPEKESPWAAWFRVGLAAQSRGINGSGAASANKPFGPVAGASCVPRLPTRPQGASQPASEPDPCGFDGRWRIARVAGNRKIGGMGIGLLEQGARLNWCTGGQPKTLVGCAEEVLMASAPRPRRVFQWWLFRQTFCAAASLGETARAAPSALHHPCGLASVCLALRAGAR